jgi:hypothetical protein
MSFMMIQTFFLASGNFPSKKTDYFSVGAYNPNSFYEIIIGFEHIDECETLMRRRFFTRSKLWYESGGVTVRIVPTLP